MALRCSTLTIFWAARLWLAGALFALGGPWMGAANAQHRLPHGVQVSAGREGDVILPLVDDVPSFGPPSAPVTIDLFLPFGHRATGPELVRYLQLQAEHDDIRLRVHPVLGSEVAERGSELLLAAWQLAGTDSAGFLVTVADHPDWLTDWPAGVGRSGPDPNNRLGSDRRQDGDLLLFAAAAQHGIAAVPLRQQLLTRRYQERAQQLWQKVRASVRTPPEVRINGRRLRSPASDSSLREELERQRLRAYQLLRAGTPLGSLYDELVATAETSDRYPTLSAPSAPSWLGSRSLLSRPGPQPAAAMPLPSRRVGRPGSGTATFQLTDIPLRGPRVSPVTLVLVGSLESGPVCEFARELRDTLRPYGDVVRFAYVPAPNGTLFSGLSLLPSSSASLSFGERSNRVPLVLAALALENSPAFFRAYDSILDLMRRRFLLSYVEFAQSILNQRVDFDRLEETSRQDRVRALVARAQRDAHALGANSLPALFLNGRLVPTTGGVGGLGAGTAALRNEQLIRLIDAELRRGAIDRLRSRRRPTP